MAANRGANKVSTADAIDVILKVITVAITRGEKVRLVGFGSFSTGAREQRAGRNPSTGETIRIPYDKTVTFTAGKAFKSRIEGA